MNPRDGALWAAVALSLVTGGASLKQQADETELSSRRIENAETKMLTEIARMRLELDGLLKGGADAKELRDLVIRMDERLKNIEVAVTKKKGW